MPRLLFVSTVPAFLKAFLLPYAAHFRGQGWQVDALASALPADKELRGQFDRVWDVRWSRNPLAPSNFRGAARTVRQAVEEGGYDIVHVHTPVAGLVTRFALRHAPHVARIYTAHGFHFHPEGAWWRNALFQTLERAAGRWTERLVVINQPDRELALRHRLVAPERLCYMPGIGVDTAVRFHPDAVGADDVAVLRAALGLRADTPAVLMLAEFIERKRHRDALQAWKALAHPQAVLLLAGDGPLEGEMKQLAHALGIAARVQFLGRRGDVPRLVKAGQALLLPSVQEGLPRSIMEAMSLGTPVVASDIRGTHELLREGAGYLYPAGDIPALTEGLRLAVAGGAEPRRWAQAARQRIGEYDLQRTIAMHEELYRAVLSEKGRRAAGPHPDTRSRPAIADAAGVRPADCSSLTR